MILPRRRGGNKRANVKTSKIKTSTPLVGRVLPAVGHSLRRGWVAAGQVCSTRLRRRWQLRAASVDQPRETSEHGRIGGVAGIVNDVHGVVAVHVERPTVVGQRIVWGQTASRLSSLRVWNRPRDPRLPERRPQSCDYDPNTKRKRGVYQNRERRAASRRYWGMGRIHILRRNNSSSYLKLPPTRLSAVTLLSVATSVSSVVSTSASRLTQFHIAPPPPVV